MKRIAVSITALTLLCVLAAGLVAAGCGGSDGGGGGGSGMPTDAVATVGDTSITQAQFQAMMAQTKTQAEGEGRTFPAPGSAAYSRYMAMIVSYLVDSEVVAQSAGKVGVSVSEQEVTDQIAQIQKATGGDAKLLSMLKKQGMTMPLLRLSVKDQMLTQRVAANVLANVTVSDAEIQAYWKAHEAKLSKKKKTATFAKAKAGIRQTLIGQAKQRVWTEWMTAQTTELGVKYAAGYDPGKVAQPSPSASATPGG